MVCRGTLPKTTYPDGTGPERQNGETSMRSEIVKYSRSRNMSSERISERGELSRSDEANPSERRLLRGRRANPPIARQNPISDEELSAQTWLDDQLLKFYHQHTGHWPGLRRLFFRVVGGRMFSSAAKIIQRQAADRVGKMSHIISGSAFGLALAADKLRPVPEASCQEEPLSAAPCNSACRKMQRA